MKYENMRFGQFIKAKRQEDSREITLKELSSELGISLSMLSDIEQMRRRPFDSDKIEAFSSYFHLTDDEKALMYDLAARENQKVPSDIEDTMMYSNVGTMARRAIRMTNAGLADEEDWKSFIRKLEEKKGR